MKDASTERAGATIATASPLLRNGGVMGVMLTASLVIFARYKSSKNTLKNEKLPERYTITAALPYANGPLHIGHMAGVYVPADIYARYLRLRKRDVVFVCGSDEHGAAITLKAKKEGISPQEVVDKYHGIIYRAFQEFGMSFDIYHRTSSERHNLTAQGFFLQLLKNGSLTKEATAQFFDPEAKQFLADRYISGTCPKCGHPGAYGDQCENCGSALSPGDLINPKSTLSGATPVLKETEHWFLPMEKHETWLREWIEQGTLDGKQHHNVKSWKRQVVGQCKSWIDGGLQPRAMTRDLDWGVPVPGEEGKVLYVWLDAPIGYISATQEWAEQAGKDWRPYWQNESTKLVHFLGKDNIVFHCLIFPILLREHGGYILPDNAPANEFLNLEGQKISTSRNWAVWLHEYLADFPGKQDELRYVLNAVAPEFRDSEFTWEDFRARINNELVAVLGNFVHRTLVLTGKFFEFRVPDPHGMSAGELHDFDITEVIAKTKTEIENQIEAYRMREAQGALMNLARAGNKLLTETEPWKLAKTDPEKAGAVIHYCLQVAANLAVLAEPMLPHKAAEMRRMLGMEEAEWEAAGTADLLTVGAAVREPKILFERIEEEEIERQLEKLRSNTKAAPTHEKETVEQAKNIAFEDFTKLDIRTGTILEAERVPKTDKLLKLLVDTGLDRRTIVSGIADQFDAEDLPGTKVTVLLNLEPRKIRGVESRGMLLMAESKEGKLSFLRSAEDLDDGATVR